MRHYLSSIADEDDRIALTKLLVSDHTFALEHFRRSSTSTGIKRLKVNHADRLCRLRGRDVESPEHALLVCSGVPELEPEIGSRRKCERDARILCSGYPPTTP